MYSQKPNIVFQVKSINELTQIFLELKEDLPLDKITLKRMTIELQGRIIIDNGYLNLEKCKSDFELLQKQNAEQKISFKDAVENSILKRQKEAQEILSSQQIIKPNASSYYEDSLIKDRILLYNDRKAEIEVNLFEYESLKHKIKFLDLEFTSIDKKIFAQQISEYNESLLKLLEIINEFYNLLIQDLDETNKQLNLLDKKYCDNGYSIATEKDQIWLEEYVKKSNLN